MAQVTIFLTSGTTWTVPADFGALVSVECIAAGAGGNSATSGASRLSGGGAAYAKITSTSTTLTPGVTVINIGVGAGGASVTSNATGNAGGDTWWNATSRANAVTLGSAVACAAQAGQAAPSNLGGTAANSVGTAKFSGGNGVAGSSNGGGGAAGPSGAGGNGTISAGGSADNGTVAGPTAQATGNSGTEFDATHGCGTGAFTVTTGFAGGLYGGGGTATNSGVASGPGANGLIVIVYTPFIFIAPKRIRNFIEKRQGFAY